MIANIFSSSSPSDSPLKRESNDSNFFKNSGESGSGARRRLTQQQKLWHLTDGDLGLNTDLSECGIRPLPQVFPRPRTEIISSAAAVNPNQSRIQFLHAKNRTADIRFPSSISAYAPSHHHRRLQ
ncbi:stearoyl-CoA 9-desaturase [Sarracenia purpurea var. burkii]